MLNFLYYFGIFALSFGPLSLLGQIRGTNIYLFDVIVILLSICGTLHFLVIKRRFRISKMITPFFIFCLWAAFSLLANLPRLEMIQFIEAVSYLLRFFFYILGANVIFNMLKVKIISQDRVVKVYIISAVLISIAGFIQLIIMPDFSLIDPALGWDPHKNRLVSTFFDPNYVGSYLVLISTLLIFKEHKPGKKISKYLLAIILIAIFLTYSRSAWGMLGIVVLIYSLFRSRWLFLLSLLIAFSAYFAIPRVQTRLAGVTDPADSAHFRFISWKNTLNIVKDNLWLGVGYNAFKASQVEYGYLTPDTIKDHSATGSDSSLLLVLATTGVLGLFIFMAGLLLPVIKTRSLYSLAVVLPLILGSNFVNSIFYPQILLLWLTIFILMDYGQSDSF